MDDTQVENAAFTGDTVDLGGQPFPFPEDLEPVVEDTATAENAVVLPFPVITPSDDDVEVDEELETFVVEYGGRDFPIDEPDVETIIRVLNFMGTVATRAERFKTANFQQAMRAAAEGNYDLLRLELYSLASVLQINDVMQLTAIVLYGGGRQNETEGMKFLSQLQREDPKSIRLAPLIKAFDYRLRQSEDLREALKNFRGASRAWNRLTRRNTPSTNGKVSSPA
jgi:hypothetical protein